jgi:hypothetical protein
LYAGLSVRLAEDHQRVFVALAYHDGHFNIDYMVTSMTLRGDESHKALGNCESTILSVDPSYTV